ncbi:hypothetical protein BD310DRAFT_711913 [Dichomitus squalens]|uniref:DUF6533 domain-containing protein n=1 Tax=Dichomitus squalens TaxID=114155 RepID=A0A4Q9PLP5_9APHY|nr:hypothetical protein BD310DRAFT_711913 [Dichomitus squalens]
MSSSQVEFSIADIRSTTLVYQTIYAATTILVYDWILFLHRETRLIWRGGRMPAVLYLANRYFGLLAFVVTVISIQPQWCSTRVNGLLTVVGQAVSALQSMAGVGTCQSKSNIP